MRPELQKKIDAAVKLLRTLSEAYDRKPIEVAYSGGKDSDVILQLTKEAGIPYRAIYKNTTIDPPGTIKHVQEMGVDVRQPEAPFFRLVEKAGYPNRLRRFCCESLKEYKILDKVIMGVRKDESIRRAKRYHEPTECRVYKKGERAEAIYPILEWTLQDVTEFLQDRKVQCAPVYYDEDGTFHPERRLGCLGCPLAYKTKRVNEFMKYPKLLRAYIRAGCKFMESHPDSKLRQKYGDEYAYFYRNLFCEREEEFHQIANGLFGRPDFKSFLENYFGVKL